MRSRTSASGKPGTFLIRKGITRIASYGSVGMRYNAVFPELNAVSNLDPRCFGDGLFDSSTCHITVPQDHSFFPVVKLYQVLDLLNKH